MATGGPVATLAATLLSAAWGASLALPHWRGELSWLDRLEAPLTDMRFLVQGQRPAPAAVTIVAIDDDAVRRAGRYPLPRASVAGLVTALAAHRPKVLALDMLFLEAGPADEDARLADALNQAPAVLAAAGVFESAVQTLPSEEAGRLARVPVAQRLLLPVGALTRSAAVGVVNVGTDFAGTPRHVPLLLRSSDRLLSSFPLRAVTVAFGHEPAIRASGVEIGGRVVATDVGYALPLRFYGPRGAIRTVSAGQVLEGTVPPGVLSDRIVVVGATVTGGGDVFPTPFDPVLPGVEVLSTAIANLAEGDGLVRDSRTRALDAATALILPVAGSMLLSWRRSLAGLAAIGGLLMLWAGLVTAAFLEGIWLSAALPLAAAGPPILLLGGVQVWAGRRRAESLEVERGTLRRFQPPSLSERLARDPQFLAAPVHQTAAVVFIDLSGFTGLSQDLGPGRTRELLASFHDIVDAEAVRHGGIVAAFMGDGAMILFGLPEPGPLDACRAVELCVGLCGAVRDWLDALPPSDSARLGFKVGAHCGPIVASRLGGGSHQHITAIGDTVNIASRLMAVAADRGAELAVGDELVRAAGAACSVFESGDLQGPEAVVIRGRSGEVPVWLWRGRRRGSGAGDGPYSH